MSGSLVRFAQKITAVLLLVGACLAVWGLAVQPAADVLQSLTSTLADEQDKLARYRAAAGELSAENARKRNSLALEKQGLLLEGASYAVKAAHIQAELVRFSRKLGIRLESTHVQPANQSASLELVTVDTTFTAPMEQVRSLLLALQDARPLLIVRSVQLTPAVERRTDGAQLLRVRLGISGVSVSQPVKIQDGADAP
ncbi:MAG: Type secretion system protein subtype b [Pseudomonadota bacterium]|jgi:hypothetical protein